VDLTDDICCEFDLLGIATGWGPSPVKITKNIPKNHHTSVSRYGKPTIMM